jgi:hypothetical protein
MENSFMIRSITTNERRTEIYFHDEPESQRFYTIDLINNIFYVTKLKNGDWVKKEAKKYDCDAIANTTESVIANLFKVPETEFWLVAYFDMLKTIMNISIESWYRRKKYEMFRRIFGTNDSYKWPMSGFKTFSPIIEKIAKQGFVVKERDLIIATLDNTADSIFNLKINLNGYRKNYTESITGMSIKNYAQKISIDNYIRTKKKFFDVPELNSLLETLKEFYPDLDNYIYESYVSHHSDFFTSMLKDYKYDGKRLVKYLFEDLKWQGIKVSTRQDFIEHSYNYNARQIFSIINDYARMSYTMKGNRSFDKYPKYLKTSHDIVTMNYQALKNEKNNELFVTVTSSERYGKYDKWLDKTKQWIMITPKVPNDLVEEGIQQHHCVASYVDNVTDGTSIILFLRKKEDVSTSVLTIEVKNGEVYQVKGLQNRSPDGIEKDIVKEFANKFNLNYDSQN